MKRLLTMFLSLLCFSVIAATNVSRDDGKDVIKQKIELVKMDAQTQMDVKITSCSENVVFNQDFTVFKEVRTIEGSPDNLYLKTNYRNSEHIYNKLIVQNNFKNKIIRISKEKLPFNNKILFHNNSVRDLVG